MITEAGSNDWKLLSTFGLSALAQALAAYKSSGVVESFGAIRRVSGSWSAAPTERFGQAARGRFDMRRANGSTPGLRLARLTAAAP